MNHQEVIEWKISQLSEQNESSVEIPSDISAYIAAHPDLQEELDFIESFYLQTPTELPESSGTMRENFYAMLESQPKLYSKTESWLGMLKKWIAPNPWPQFVALMAVFFIGLNLNDNQQQSTAISGQSENYPALQQEISSLTSVVAISMLQKSHASERLTGVAYSKQVALNDPKLNELLLDRLQHDSSTAVRLAIINALAQNSDLAVQHPTLSEIALGETNPLVQMALFRLIFENASATETKNLLEKLNQIELNQDVENFVEQLQTQFKA